MSLRGSEATEAKQGEAEASLVIHLKKADSSAKVDRHAVQAPLAMTEKRRFCVKKILRIAVGLWLFYTIFGAELDLGSAVASKIV